MPSQYHAALGPAPRSVETVINHRVVNGRHIIVGVSGGVHVAPWSLTNAEAIKADTYGASGRPAQELDGRGLAAGSLVVGLTAEARASLLCGRLCGS